MIFGKYVNKYYLSYQGREDFELYGTTVPYFSIDKSNIFVSLDNSIETGFVAAIKYAFGNFASLINQMAVIISYLFNQVISDIK